MMGAKGVLEVANIREEKLLSTVSQYVDWEAALLMVEEVTEEGKAWTIGSGALRQRLA